MLDGLAECLVWPSAHFSSSFSYKLLFNTILSHRKSLENSFYHFSFFYDLIITLSINTCMIWIHVAWGWEGERERTAVLTHIYSISFSFLFQNERRWKKVSAAFDGNFPQTKICKKEENFLCASKFCFYLMLSDGKSHQKITCILIGLSRVDRDNRLSIYEINNYQSLSSN